MLPELRTRGQRVEVATVRPEDIPPYRAAVLASVVRLSRWNPVDPEDLGRHLRAQSQGHRTFIVRALDREGGHGIVGKVNVTNVVRGRFQSAAIGYDAYDPYVGRGLFSEGLHLVVGLAFARDPHGMGLHRLEANVQPGNATSAGVLRRLGFRREGHIPDMLWLADGAGQTAWRDHDSFAITAGEWPAPPYGAHRPARTIVLVNGLPGAGKSTLARRLSQELSAPLYGLGAEHHELLWRLLADSPAGGVVDSHFTPDGERDTMTGLARARAAVDRVLQVWCGEEGGAADRSQPLDLPHTVRVDTTELVPDREVAAIALRARAVS